MASRGTQALQLADGRRLAYCERGPADAPAVVVFHGLPGSRFQQAPEVEGRPAPPARLVHFDRPGFGLSDPRPGGSLLDVADDVARLADHLGLERFRVLGVSGGGPFALACAARLGERVAAVAVAAGVGLPGSHATAARADIRFAFRTARVLPAVLALPFGVLARLARRHPARYLDTFRASLLEVDRAVVDAPGRSAMLLADAQESVRQGTAALIADLRRLTRPWPFHPAAVRCPAGFWYGSADPVVPVAAGRALAGAVAGARFEVLDGAGHFFVLERWPEILAWLLRAGG